MIAALGVLLLLAGVSILIIGLLRVFFPSTERFVPNDFKVAFSWRTGVYMIAFAVLILVVIRG